MRAIGAHSSSDAPIYHLLFDPWSIEHVSVYTSAQLKISWVDSRYTPQHGTQSERGMASSRSSGSVGGIARSGAERSEARRSEAWRSSGCISLAGCHSASLSATSRSQGGHASLMAGSPCYASLAGPLRFERTLADARVLRQTNDTAAIRILHLPQRQHPCLLLEH